MTDVTRMLEQDHRTVEDLFKRIRQANGEARRKLVAEIADDLHTHMRVEESIVYPFIATTVGHGKEMVKEAKTEHEGARKALVDVERLAPDEPGFDGALEMLEAGIAHHVEEEETEVFPKLRKSAGARQLEDLGRQVETAKGGSGWPGLETLSRDELYQQAQAAGVPGRSSMTKDELIAALSGRG
jgi:iron-sulfur cluster repair protein YtfE (RIC family)